MEKSLSLKFIYMFVCIYGLAACKPSIQQNHDKKTVVTTFTILADMVREVAGDTVMVESITKPGAEIHGYEPTPKDIVKAQHADLIVWNGLNLELWFEKFFQNVEKVPQVLLTEGISPISIQEGSYAGKPNPHAWMSPNHALIYVENIRKALTQLNPSEAALYQANAERYSKQIQSLITPVRERLATIPESQRYLVTSEGAFHYIAEAYGMKTLYLWAVNSDSQGTPQQIQHVIDHIRRHQIPVMFSESTISDKPAKQVAKETGIRYGGILYVDSLTGLEGEAPTYLKLLEHNASTILKGFSLAP